MANELTNYQSGGFDLRTGGNKTVDIADDFILPSQVSSSQPEYIPEKELLRAILQDALILFGKFFSRDFVMLSTHQKNLIIKAREWIFLEWHTYGGFDFTCEQLNLDPEYFRERFRDMLKRYEDPWQRDRVRKTPFTQKSIEHMRHTAGRANKMIPESEHSHAKCKKAY